MSKTSGIPTSLSVDNHLGSLIDISGDVTNFAISTPRDMQVTTGLDKLAMERLLLVADASVELTGVFNAALSHAVFNTVGLTDVARTVTVVLPPGTGGSPKLSMELLFESYEIQRGANGSFGWTATGRIYDGATVTWTTS